MEKPSKRVVAVGAAAAVVVGVVVGFRMGGKDRGEHPAQESSEVVSVARSPESVSPVLSQPVVTFAEPETTAAVEIVVAAPAEQAATTATAPQDVPEDTHYYNGMDPNQQPRSFVHVPFSKLKTVPNGYETTGDFHLSEGGLTLAPLPPGVKDKARIAMIESPALSLDFQSNAVNPLWKEESPPGTEVLVEVSLSQDGVKWTDWMPTTSAHYEGEMSPTYPDGRPNPNYGYTLGDMTFYGLTRFQYFRYAITMYSESEASPVVSDFRLFHQDSTMGDAELAQANGTAQEQEGAAR